MSNGNPNTPATPKSVLELLKDWKELIVFVALTVSSALTGIFGNEHPKVQRASWILAVLFVGGGAYVVHQKQKRKREQARRERLWAEREAQRKPQSAFRSLAPFEERDELPGRDRRIEARSIATRIASDGFRFGVLCGDSGCGKTSLLRSQLTRTLRELGFDVSYVRSPSELERKSSDALLAPDRLARQMRALWRTVQPTTEIVILDQFEDWFIEYHDIELRKHIGRSLTRLSTRIQPVRVVCAIRRDFLIDFHDISNELPQPLSNTNLFHIKNFTIDQAVDVIAQCATSEGIALDDSFAQTVAHDLAEASQVRPPELQIVCTYLAAGGGLSTPKYRKAGGTSGILAHYIQEALDASKERDLAARLLRALCDFPAHSKQKPKTIDELTDITTGGSGAEASSRKAVEQLAHHFVSGRILAEEYWNEGKAFSLMHDYLVPCF